MPRNKAFQQEEALEKAMNVFWKKGYNAASMEDLVQGMGINRASMYDTFGDKKQLYIAAMKHYQSKSMETNSKILQKEAASPKRQLIAVLEYQLEDSLKDKEQKGCFLANSTSEMALLDTDICAFVKENIKNVEGMMRQLIEAAQAKGEIRPSLNAEFAATFLTNYLHGFRTVTKTKPDAKKMRESLKLALSLLD